MTVVFKNGVAVVSEEVADAMYAFSAEARGYLQHMHPKKEKMDNKEIEQGNKLIAEFMGYVETKFNSSINVFTDKEGQLPTRWFSIDHACYHSCWDELMPVVEKINHMPHKMGVIINNETICVQCIRNTGMLVAESIVKVEIGDNPLILSLWSAIVSFVTWYNANINPNK